MGDTAVRLGVDIGGTFTDVVLEAGGALAPRRPPRARVPAGGGAAAAAAAAPVAVPPRAAAGGGRGGGRAPPHGTPPHGRAAAPSCVFMAPLLSFFVLRAQIWFPVPPRAPRPCPRATRRCGRPTRGGRRPRRRRRRCHGGWRPQRPRAAHPASCRRGVGRGGAWRAAAAARARAGGARRRRRRRPPPRSLGRHARDGHQMGGAQHRRHRWRHRTRLGVGGQGGGGGSEEKGEKSPTAGIFFHTPASPPPPVLYSPRHRWWGTPTSRPDHPVRLAPPARVPTPSPHVQRASRARGHAPLGRPPAPVSARSPRSTLRSRRQRPSPLWSALRTGCLARSGATGGSHRGAAGPWRARPGQWQRGLRFSRAPMTNNAVGAPLHAAHAPLGPLACFRPPHWRRQQRDSRRGNSSLLDVAVARAPRIRAAPPPARTGRVPGSAVPAGRCGRRSGVGADTSAGGRDRNQTGDPPRRGGPPRAVNGEPRFARAAVASSPAPPRRAGAAVLAATGDAVSVAAADGAGPGDASTTGPPLAPVQLLRCSTSTPVPPPAPLSSPPPGTGCR